MKDDDLVYMRPRNESGGYEEIEEFAAFGTLNIKSKLRVLFDQILASNTVNKTEIKDLALLLEMAMTAVKDIHHGDELHANVVVDRLSGSTGNGVRIIILFVVPVSDVEYDFVMELRLQTACASLSCDSAEIEYDCTKLTHREDSKFNKMQLTNILVILMNMLVEGADSGFYAEEEKAVQPDANRYIAAKRIGNDKVVLISLIGDNGNRLYK